MRYRVLLPLLLGVGLLAACTRTEVAPLQGNRDGLLVRGTASCAGLCAPDRSEIYQAMHRRCTWPAVPAIQLRGTESNGLIGTPHAAWRFTCLTVTPQRNVAGAAAGTSQTNADREADG